MSPTTHVIVRYKVKAGHVRNNEELVRAVYQELEQTQPAGLRYSTFKLDDGHTFIHLAETQDGHRPLPELGALPSWPSARIRRRRDRVAMPGINAGFRALAVADGLRTARRRRYALARRALLGRGRGSRGRRTGEQRGWRRRLAKRGRPRHWRRHPRASGPRFREPGGAHWLR